MIFKGEHVVAEAATAVVLMQQIRNQTELDWTNEVNKFNINSATSAATAVQMPYDGILTVQTPYNLGVKVNILNKDKTDKCMCMINGQGLASGSGQNIKFCKGDWLYFTNPASSNAHIFFYKKRDYTGR